MGHFQSYIRGDRSHITQENALAVIPLYLELFGRPETRRRVGEKPATLQPTEVADGLKVSLKLFDNRRRVSIRKIEQDGKPAWLLVATPERVNAADVPAAMAARQTWLREIGLG